MGQYDCYNGVMSEEEIELRKKIADFVNRDNAYKNFDEQVHERILGQKNLSEITYNVFMWLRGLAENSAIRNNAMIVAPSGCGKTETYRTIKDIIAKEISDIPVIQLDVTKLTSEGFKGMDSKDFFGELFTESVNGIAIVVLDEIDKRLIPDCNAYGDNVNAVIQSQLLTLIEGTEFSKESGDCIVTINTSNTLFVAAGAFQSIRDKRKALKEKNRSEMPAIGFVENKIQEYKDEIQEEDDISLGDIIENGAMYEFMGRFSTVINLHMLDFESVKTIIGRYATEYSKNLKCKICVSETVAEEMYEIYLNNGFGCRILKSLLWNRISPMGIEIERNNYVNKGNEITIICDTRGDAYIVNSKVFNKKKENVA